MNLNDIDNSRVISSDLTKKIEYNYLYWDKLKYLDFLGEKNSIKLWNYTKIRRFLNQKLVLFGKLDNDDFLVFNINEFLQQRLHYLDFNFGTGLQKERLLNDLDKQDYLNNALMEESIFSSMIVPVLLEFTSSFLELIKLYPSLNSYTI